MELDVFIIIQIILLLAIMYIIFFKIIPINIKINKLAKGKPGVICMLHKWQLQPDAGKRNIVTNEEYGCYICEKCGEYKWFKKRGKNG